MSENANSPNRKIWSFKIVIYLLIIILFLSLIGGNIYYKNMVKGVNTEKNGVDITFEIKKGSSTKSIANTLEKNKLIKNQLIFRIVAKLEKKEGNLKAGKYTINNSNSVYEILNQLEKGGLKKETITFTIPEGYELNQIAKKLSELGLVNEKEFLNLASNISNFKDKYEFINALEDDATLEGFLFPNTYEVYKNASEEEIIEKMLNEFNKIYLDKIKNNKNFSGLTLNELITLASIIEREGKVDQERPIMAGVFYNRLKIGQKLESCATVQYILGERKPNLTYKDLEIESPYNTYLNEGLPPAPIASPGLESILATLNPDKNDYLYFVLKKDGSGTHVFSTNYNDHLRAKNSN